jgi:hypothetical protein
MEAVHRFVRESKDATVRLPTDNWSSEDDGFTDGQRFVSGDAWVRVLRVRDDTYLVSSAGVACS